ncbi:hypothetical protein DPM33_15160 [Mesorhizobium hawassense]|uniref:Uncharacterized protein n=1 Tax=Mesorhizobium hawassense TaxID=1209954 RepID=A0A330HNW8_9HYPH|nr:hypothetical protein [Mesorhizobium hawassense]RAZ90165.1 hypothetical protein DPM33_15160 [Mesorhizobium hawassense]
MALLDFNGFDHWETSPNPQLMPNFATSTSAGFQLGTGLLGGKSLQSGASTRTVRWNNGSTFSTLIVGFRFKTGTGTATTSDLLWFVDAATTQCGLSINTANKLIFWRGTNATVLATGSTVLSANSWYFIEAKITFHNSTGAYTIKLGGATELSGSGVDNCATANNQADTINIPLINGGVSSQMTDLDDLYVSDTTGSSPYNDLLGVIRVETAFVTSNDSVQWTASASTNASCVDETSVNDDTDYNSDATAGHIDLFNHGSLSSTPVTIFSVAIKSRARKDDVTARTYRNKLKSSSTTSDGGTVSLDTTYKWIADKFDNDPATGSAWANAAAVNATKIGYEVVS